MITQAKLWGKAGYTKEATHHKLSLVHVEQEINNIFDHLLFNNLIMIPILLTWQPTEPLNLSILSVHRRCSPLPLQLFLIWNRLHLESIIFERRIFRTACPGHTSFFWHCSGEKFRLRKRRTLERSSSV